VGRLLVSGDRDNHRTYHDRRQRRPLQNLRHVTDVGLKKICAKHRIPVPGRGYWAKVAAGKPVARQPLRDSGDASTVEVPVRHSVVCSLPDEVVEARRRAMEVAGERKQAVDAELSGRAEPHPSVVRLKERLEKAKPKDYGLLHVSGSKLLAVTISPASMDRALAILDLLAREAEARHYQIEAGDEGSQLKVQGEVITVHLLEKTRRIPHEPTAKEAAALRRWDAGGERQAQRGQPVYEWNKPRIPRWDHVPSGRLVLEIDRGLHSDGLQRRFADRARQPLEQAIDQVLTEAAACAAAARWRCEEAERRRIAGEEAERRRREAERRARLDGKRWELLQMPMARLERAERIDAFVRAYTGFFPEDELLPSCRALLDWAAQEAASLRGAIAPEQLAKVLDHHKLMDDDTDIQSWVELE
jgi:hypothetical protein